MLESNPPRDSRWRATPENGVRFTSRAAQQVARLRYGFGVPGFLGLLPMP
jgi:hypothetical protein